ncbi:phage terminase small subunit P27 family [Paraburkholderia adhaesiva]|uniref:phage terminase small subunit P27 family n=1 Tax=Paraburkholderia adhaesiva TaxID=2883244 RepID=UPI001F3CAA70|nr:phage terminase small subunit P27 family [Paraburkholderia adhaesiva]
MPTRGTRPKPTALKVITGNPGGRPLPEREPKPRTGVLRRPRHLDANACAEWDRLVPELRVAGILTSIDVAVLAAYCMAYSRWIDAEEAIQRMKVRDQLTSALMIKTTNGNAIQNPLVGVANRAMLIMSRLASEFGMTPAARTRIEPGVPNGDEPDEARHYF